MTEKILNQLKVIVVNRKQKWEDAKDSNHPTSIFVCNRRIKKLDEALEFISELERVDAYTASH